MCDEAIQNPSPELLKLVSRFEILSSPARGEGKRYGFTLAEVLITLGIIGVIAAITIPTLIQNANEKANVTALKKTYSTLSNAFTLAVQENDTINNWDLVGSGSPQGAENILNNIATYLIISKNCGRNSGCFPNLKYKFLKDTDTSTWININNFTNQAKAQLSDGSLISVQTYGDCLTSRGNSMGLENVCGVFYVDVNGFKSPNQAGKDFFMFWISESGIIPAGIQLDTSAYNFANNCKLTSTGEGCAGWVIYNENWDYLHCNDLAWGGKTKCD